MSTLGQLYVFEGVDGAGKSSVAAAFVRNLQENGVNTRSLAFPGNLPNTLGALVYRIHHEPRKCGVETLTPTGLQALHIAAHLDAIEATIIPALERGENVVLDRFWWSTWVYGLVGGIPGDVLHALIEAERRTWGRWKPTCAFYVTRASPLRPEPMENWSQLKIAYRELIASERGKYPIQVLENEGTPTTVLDQALSHVAVS